MMSLLVAILISVYNYFVINIYFLSVFWEFIRRKNAVSVDQKYNYWNDFIIKSLCRRLVLYFYWDFFITIKLQKGKVGKVLQNFM